ncbi:MAG: hypothetical protein KF845_12240 [Cyclobacteriaceae bacterium]|nr:hypothetical protein [Cyclobacteriaceae bacterium]
MKFTVQLVAIVIMSWLLELFLPWWSIAIAGFLGGVAFKSKSNFLAGFIAIALLWFLHAFIIDLQAAAPLSEKIAALLMVKNKVLLFLVTAVIGGLVGGFATLTGSLLKKSKKR